MVLYDERVSVDHFSRTLQADVETIHYYFSFFSEVSFIVQCSIMLKKFFSFPDTNKKLECHAQRTLYFLIFN